MLGLLLLGLAARAAAGDRCEEARRVLDENWRESIGSTLPSSSLYPHQWSWDTAFIATGHASINISRAKSELRRLFDAQWSNGMVPHIAFNPEVPATSYFPGVDWWKSSEAARGVAPADIETSGITNPPVHTAAVLRIADAGHRDFMEEMWPKLDALLSYFHNERTPAETGLVYVRHPWENGMDNSPLWDVPLYEGIPNSSLADLPPYNRTDLHKGVDPRDRPSQAFYDRAVYILLEARKRGYDERRMWHDGLPFAVYDSFFNALVVRGYEEMVEIAERLDRSADAERYREWAESLAVSMEKLLWDEEKGVYGNLDVNTNKRTAALHVTGLAPLVYVTRGSSCAAKRRLRVQRLLSLVRSGGFCGQGTCRPLPTLARGEPSFSSRNYWRGPVWINTNWLLAAGLARQGAEEESQRVLASSRGLVDESGMHEYFDPLTGAPHGTDGFSWTAALYHDSFCRQVPVFV